MNTDDEVLAKITTDALVIKAKIDTTHRVDPNDVATLAVAVATLAAAIGR